MIAAEATEQIDRPVDTVFAFVTNPGNEPRWHTDVIEAEFIDPPPLRVGSKVRWIMSFMGRKEQVMEVSAYEQDQLLEMKGHTILGLTPTITYLFQPDPDGSRFTRRIQMETSGVGKLFAPVLKAKGPEHNRGFVENVKRILEGE